MRIAVHAGALVALAASCLGLPTLSRAEGPSLDLISPIVEEGEKEIEFKAGTAKNRDGTRESAYSLGLGWGVTRWWSTELSAIGNKPPGEGNSFGGWEWENKFQLTETGKYPVDVGFLIEVERPRDRSEGYEYKWGPLFQTDISNKVQANLNVLIEKQIRAAVPARAELGYQWQVKYRYKPTFEFGLQGFGDVGPWDHWERGSDQPHIAGPAIFGEVRVGQKHAIKYNAGLLFGLTDAAARNTLRVQAEYEF